MTKQHSTADDLRTIKRLIVGALVVVVGIGTFFYLSARATDQRFEREQDAQQEATALARVRSCEQSNVAVERKTVEQGDIAEDNARDYLAQLAKSGAAIDYNSAPVIEYIAGQRASSEDAVRRNNPLRDCTKAGVDAFLSRPPDSPPTTCVGDGKGFCK